MPFAATGTTLSNLGAVLVACTFVFGLAEHASAQAFIQSAVPDETLRTLTIKGGGFGLNPPPEVYLESTPLSLVSNTPSELVAQLPSMAAAGSYGLFVFQGADYATFYVGIGELGRATASPQGTATAGAAFASEPLLLGASAFNTATQAEERQTFRWRVDPVSSNTADPSGRLRLAFGANGATPANTGLWIQENGALQFAAGQPVPGVASVTAGSGISMTGTAAAPVVNIAPGAVTSAMLATSAVTSADILNGQVAVTDLAFDPATQAELTAHEHDARHFTETTAADLFHPVYTHLLYSDRHVGGFPGGPIFNPFTQLEVGTFTKRRADSRILLIWNGSVRVDKNDAHPLNNDQCGYQLGIDFHPSALGESGQGWSFVEDESVPMNVSATFDDLEAGEHMVVIRMRGNGGAINGPQACEINPASIPESVIVVESGR